MSIDHEYTKEIVCPWCGHELDNAWKYAYEEYIGLVNCGNCDKELYVYASISVTYSTEKAEYGTCTHCKKPDVVIEDWRFDGKGYKSYCPSCRYKCERELKKEHYERWTRENGS